MRALSVNFKMFLLFFCLFCFSNLSAKINEKVLICGVCKNVEQFLSNDFANIQRLKREFQDYAVIIYENNSTDNTKAILQDWARQDSRIFLISENLTESQLLEGVRCVDWRGHASRMEMIAKGRNRVLEVVKKPQFDSFKYVIMVDLDFLSPWPVDEIMKTITISDDWDCVSANGINPNGDYYDRYALRTSQNPLGPELLGDIWWNSLAKKPIKFKGQQWIAVNSAFGGLSIYKRESIMLSDYRGYVTEELESFTQQVFSFLSCDHPEVREYRNLNGLSHSEPMDSIPIIFRDNSGYSNYPVCCEHVTFHASMILHGFYKIYINPQLILRY